MWSDVYATLKGDLPYIWGLMGRSRETSLTWQLKKWTGKGHLFTFSQNMILLANPAGAQADGRDEAEHVPDQEEGVSLLVKMLYLLLLREYTLLRICSQCGELPADFGMGHLDHMRLGSPAVSNMREIPIRVEADLAGSCMVREDLALWCVELMGKLGLWLSRAQGGQRFLHFCVSSPW